MRNSRVCGVLVLLGGSYWLPAADGPSYQRDIRPLLEQRCQACHQGTAPGGQLSLASAAGLIKGGVSGPAVLPGNPDGSLLIRMISGEKPMMPKAGKPLAAQEITQIREWVAAGALDDTPAGSAPKIWWSLAPIGKQEPPKVDSTWPQTPVDSFVLARMNGKRLAPSPSADRRTLIRRITYGLHGLPPTWEETQAFIADKAPDAYEKLVDRLLASPRYGERWGRHWLDVVHYGESHGYDKDKPRRNAWPYRDYVIESFNRDKPYAQFVEEQLAGDVLFPNEPDATVALGFISAGPWDFVGHVELREDTTDKRTTRLLDRDDMVMTAMSSLTSMTVHCARCHDHKFDPISQEDYYSLQAVFAGVDRADRPVDKDPETWERRRPLLSERRSVMAKLQPLLYRLAELTSPELERHDEEVREWRRKLAENSESGLKEKIEEAGRRRERMVRNLLPDPVRAEIENLEASLKEVDGRISALPPPMMVYAASNFFPAQSNFRWPIQPRPVYLLARGNVDAPGHEVQPGALSSIEGLPSRFNVTGSMDEGRRRAALARWITDPRNPLTWRSIVNRVWHYHFGAGLVDSPNDFGRMGSLPTHPELLDWLARWFQVSGGSMKKLHRMLLLSSTYRQASWAHPQKTKIDSENRFLWRMNRARLDAESVRDSALFVAGKLDLTMGGPSAEQFVFKDDHSPVYDYARFDIDSASSQRRSVYRFVVRSAPDPFMDRLDCPDPSLMTGKRNTTITAIQALALMNNPLIVRQAEHLAQRLRNKTQDPEEQIVWLYRTSLLRDPSPPEISIARDYLTRFGLENTCRLALNTNEFMFVD